ncbi:hypothetical protein HZR81_04945 [Pseudomonas sp. LM13]
MSFTDFQFPTLGHFNKVLCDCLGLWSSDGKSVKFHVPASEKARRAALRSAFEAIKRENGTYGSLDELVSVTTQIAPESKQEVRKSKTIQSYVSYLAKEDYSSYEELRELTGYIEILVHEKYGASKVSDLAAKLYTSALLHYREFIREYSATSEDCIDAYQGFLAGTMIDLVRAISDVEPRGVLGKSTETSRWPLREFVEKFCKETGVTPYKLHQFHALRKQSVNCNLTDSELWGLDFSSKPVSTQSKQVFERMSKEGKIKWEVIYPFIKPLACLLPAEAEGHGFANKAFCAFVSHNLYMHATEIGDFDPSTQPQYPKIKTLDSATPISDCIDQILHDDVVDEKLLDDAFGAYHEFLTNLRSTGAFLPCDTAIPDGLAVLYKKDYLKFFEKEWLSNLTNSPAWIEDWSLASRFMLTGASESALKHFKQALEKAKYSAGPLFIPFYVQVCAFCKSQFKVLSRNGEEEVFDRFYDSLGGEAAKYAGLLGYTPGSTRDPETLLPKFNLPGKNRLIIQEIDILTRWLLNGKKL